MKRTVRSDPALYKLANAIREVLGLDPLPKTAPDARFCEGQYVPEEERLCFAHVYAWDDANNIPATYGVRRHGGA